MRRFTLQTLRDFGVGKSSIEEKIMVEINAVDKVLQHSKNLPLIIAPLFQNLVGNVIYGIVFGQRYFFTYVTEFILFSAVLEDSVLSMG